MPKCATPPETPQLSRNARKAIEGLNELYHLGRSALTKTDLVDGRSAYGSGAVLEFAEDQGLGKSCAYEARNFANSYSSDDFDELIQMCTANNSTFGFSHIVELLRVGNENLRRQLQQSAIEGKWSVRRLREEVKMVLS